MFIEVLIHHNYFDRKPLLINVVIPDPTLLIGVLVTIYHGQWGVQFISHLMI